MYHISQPHPGTELRQVSAMHCVPAAQRETAILNLADENGSDEEVRSDRRDSRGLPETCNRRDWRIKDPTWRKRDPTWRKRYKIGGKVNFVREFFYIRLTRGNVILSASSQSPRRLLRGVFGIQEAPSVGFAVAEIQGSSVILTCSR